VERYVLAVFAVVYLGMVLGRLPGLALDRAGVAVLGAIALIAGGALSAPQAWAAVDVPTISLLFGLMVVSAQLRLGGFYTWLTRHIGAVPCQPAGLLALVIAAAALLSALLANDIVCLAMTPILVEGCGRRGLAPMPYLLGLSCAANIGSAATLIGNPQNMLIGQVAALPFGPFLADAAAPTVASLAAAWAIIVFLHRGRWTAPARDFCVEAPDFNLWQSSKGLAVLAVLVAAYLAGPWPRELPTLALAGVLLLSRRMTSRRMFGLVDWQLLLLFMGLFVVNHAVAEVHLLDRLYAELSVLGLDPSRPVTLYGLTVVLSNLVSNVPAVMLLLPAASSPQAALLLSLASTLAGNLLLVGSIANLIVAEQARPFGIHLGWAAHARIGLPVTIASLVITGAWLAWRWDALAVSAIR